MPDVALTEADKLLEFLNNPLNQIVARLAIDASPDDLDGHALADFHEATFPGYAGQRVSGFVISPDSVDDLAEAVSDAVTWTAGDIVTPQMVTMVFLTRSYDGSAPELWFVIPLEDPIRFSKSGHSLTRIVRCLGVAGLNP